MKKLIFLCLTNLMFVVAIAQSADDYFNISANHYIDGNKSIALNTLDRGIKTYPSDEYLPLLKKRILEEEENQQDQQDQQDQGEQNEEEQQEQEQGQNQEGKEEQDQDGDQNKEGEEKKEGEEGEEQQQQGEESEEQGEENKDKPQPSTQEKLDEMNISEEKARMILEAMQNNEIQYIQQQRRKQTKPTDSDKPDW